MPDPNRLSGRLLTLQQMSDACADYRLTPDDFERVTVPLARCPDAERVRVAKWAALRGGPVPTNTTAYRLRPMDRQATLDLAVPPSALRLLSPGADSAATA